MKRGREEALVGTQHHHHHHQRSPATPAAAIRHDPPRRTPTEAAATSQPHRAPSNEAALEYLNEVKETFQDRTEKYGEFLQIMKDFKSGSLNTPGVIDRVKELFQGNRRLILGFNNFLPKGYEITLPSEDKKPVEFNEAIVFVNKIKARFQNDEHVYKAFLDILNMYRKEHKSIHQVYQEVAGLFNKHNDLLEEFTHFLPDASTGMSPHPFTSNRHFYRKDERSHMEPPTRHANGDKRERKYHLDADRDISVNRPEQDFEKMQRNVDRKDSNDWINYNGNVDLEYAQCKTRLSRRFDDSGTAQCHQDGKGIEKLGGCGISTVCLDESILKNSYPFGFKFCRKVRDKLQPAAYQEFLKCLHVYSSDIISKNELKSLVTDVLGKYPDLLDGFDKFFAYCDDTDGFLASIFRKGAPLKADEKDRNREIEMDDVERNRDRDRGNERDTLDKRTPFGSKDMTCNKSPLSTNRDKQHLHKPISELDLSDCPRCTPSYRLLPKSYVSSPVSHRTELGAAVLNDLWVSVTSGSEDYSFKHMRKNQYEESLFRCEDDRFEMDMLLESVNATTRRVEELLCKLQDSSKLENELHLEDHFNSLNLRCIERIYGDHGLDVLEILRKNVSLTLPVILTRLKQKQEEWLRCRSDFNKVWAEIYAKNHHKSLDHRSFYFKQQDAKTLSAKALAMEIKEINEKKPVEDDTLLAIVSGQRHPVNLDLEFDYVDTDIHEDLYQIIKYSCEVIRSSTDQVDKVMSVWTTFLEPFLGIPPRPEDTSGSDQLVKTKDQAMKIGEEYENEINDVEQKSQEVMSLANGCRTSTGQTAGLERVDDLTYCNSTVDISSKDPASGCSLTSSLSSGAVREALPDLRNGQVLSSANDEDDVKASPSADGGCINESEKAFILDKSVAYLDESNVEREEGELSPNCDFEEDSFEALEDGNNHVDSKSKVGSPCKQYLVEDGEVMKVAQDKNGGPDVNGEGTTHRSRESSENASEAGDEVSGSEPGDAEECSPENQNEDAEEDVESQKAASENDAEESGDANGELASLPVSERFLHTVKPLCKRVPAAFHDKENKGSELLYGNESLYVLFRLHQTLYERILSAKRNSSSAERKWNTSKDASPLDLYAKFKSALYDLLDGSADNTKFEDDCRAIIGTQSYLLFTLDKLIFRIIKQLQLVASEDMDNKILHLYMYEKSRQPGTSYDIVYYENARALLQDESMYRIESFLKPTRLSIQLMDHGHEKPDMSPSCIKPNFASYLYNDFLSSTSSYKEVPGIFLRRNLQKHEEDDEYTAICRAMEGVQMNNGLECKISCTSSKISYVLDTEDHFHRMKKRSRYAYRSSSSCSYQANSTRIQEFHRFLSRS